MGKQDDESRFTRRDFLRKAAVGAAAAAGAASGMVPGLPAVLAATSKTRNGMRYRVLGRTKLKVSELSFGTIQTKNAEVIRRGMDLGINYFDTSDDYRDGNSEIDLGKALKGRRDKAVVATKWNTDGKTPAADLLKSLDGSLKRLDMDHVDLIQIHGAENEEQVNSDELWEAFTTARKAGKTRFNGFSSHSNQVTVIRAAIKSGRYDAVLPAHSALTADNIGPVLAEAKKAGVGIIVMKALAAVHDGKGSEAFQGLKGNPYQAAIQWVLKDPNVSTVIVDMPTFDELEQNVAAVTGAVSTAQLEEFEVAVATIAAGTCHLCGACTGQCPAGVRVADIMRYMLYHDGYGDESRALGLYRALPASSTAAACADCGKCRAVCPWGVPVRSRMERAHAVLA
ncbi:MAG: aldo/keto reductase [Armatimonadota bacterium]